MNSAFLDTSYAVALSTPADEHHTRARALAERILHERPRLITTDAILLEIGNFFSRQAVRTKGASVIAAILRDLLIQVVHPSPANHAAAFRLYEDRPDKEWGMTDCLSFIVMTENGVNDALTADAHFQQAGFRALMLQP